MIEDVITGERNTFTALPELVIFLRNYADVGARAPSTPPALTQNPNDNSTSFHQVTSTT